MGLKALQCISTTVLKATNTSDNWELNATIDCPLDSVVAQSGNGTDLRHDDAMASKQELLHGNSGLN